MFQSLIDKRTKVLVVQRQAFASGAGGQPSCCFLGELGKAPEMLCKLLGRYWHLGPIKEVVIKIGGQRLRAPSFEGGAFTAYFLPRDTKLEYSALEISKQGELALRARPISLPHAA